MNKESTRATAAPDLLPCPFCNDEAVRSKYFTFGCQSCAIWMQDGWESVWNRRAQPVQQHSGNTDSTGREVVEPMTVADLMRVVRANWGDDAAIERAFMANVAAREPAPVAEKVSCPECSGTGGVMMEGDCTDCNGKGYGWEPIEQATAESAPASAAPDEQVYRLIDTRDTLKADDEWLAEDAVTWRTGTPGVFVGMRYAKIMLPARRRAAPSNSSPVGAEESK